MIEIITVNLLLSIFVYSIIGSLGAFSKELYNYVKEKQENCNRKINKLKILIGAILTALAMPTLEIYLIDRLQAPTFILLGFLMGVLSNELFESISTLARLKNFIKEIKELKSMASQLKKSSDKKEDNNK